MEKDKSIDQHIDQIWGEIFADKSPTPPEFISGVKELISNISIEKELLNRTINVMMASEIITEHQAKKALLFSKEISLNESNS